MTKRQRKLFVEEDIDINSTEQLRQSYINSAAWSDVRSYAEAKAKVRELKRDFFIRVKMAEDADEAHAIWYQHGKDLEEAVEEKYYYKICSEEHFQSILL